MLRLGCHGTSVMMLVGVTADDNNGVVDSRHLYIRGDNKCGIIYILLLGIMTVTMMVTLDIRLSEIVTSTDVDDRGYSSRRHGDIDLFH